MTLVLLGCDVSTEPDEVAAVTAKGSSEANEEVYGDPCSEAVTTPDMVACYGSVVRQAETRHAQYLALALERQSATPDLASQITTSERAFIAYRRAECDAVRDSYGNGSIKGVMGQLCRIKTTDERTHTIWRNWLHHADSTPPALPEPEPLL